MEQMPQAEEYYAVRDAHILKEQHLEEALHEASQVLARADEQISGGFDGKEAVVKDILERSIEFIAMYEKPEDNDLISKIRRVISDIDNNLYDSESLLTTYNEIKLKILWYLGRGALNFVRPRNPIAKWDQKLLDRMQIKGDKNTEKIFAKKKVNSGA
jgi:hypothetical protein